MLNQNLLEARQNFIQGMSRISNFWGFPKAMGAIFGAIYLSPMPISLDEIVEKVGVTKGSVSTNVRTLERLGMVHKQIRVGDRKDYYEAEADFWKIIKGVLREREKSEFDLALRTVNDSLEMVKEAKPTDTEADLVLFYQQRMENMQRFFNTLDNIVATLLALDNLRLNSVRTMFGKTTQGGKE
ncbi:MAG: MarR family transcriptional regulator [Candidatus Promineifilaceae bacterium]|nr:MarR family transcriptional regulator [Candidatus Promineifilaceae bacterium]